MSTLINKNKYIYLVNVQSVGNPLFSNHDFKTFKSMPAVEHVNVPPVGILVNTSSPKVIAVE